MLESLQASSLAETMSQSQLMLAGLSSLHLLGLALVLSAVFGASLRSCGVLFVPASVRQVYRTANRLLAAGLTISVVTGFLMFMPRAVAAAANQTFRMKLALMGAGLAVYVFSMTRATSESASDSGGRVLAASTVALWLGVVLAACAFILLE